jgi:uncharacterized membrane protein YoaK (UPF0700 family)
MSFNLLLFTDFHIATSLIFGLIALKYGDWRNWQKYYSTILFFMMGNYIYCLFACHYALWSYESPLLGKTLSQLFVTLSLYPATTLLYLPFFPKKKLIKQIFYIFLWVLIYSTIEKVSYLIGFFSYAHGWSFGWSVLFNCLCFPC